MRRNLKRLFATATLVVGIGMTSVTFAQPSGPPGPPGGGGGTPPCWPPPCVPVDGGASWLILAGLAFGAKKAYDLNKKHKEVG